MLYREIIAVCSQIHTKHTNTVCGQNVELLNVKLAVQTAIISLYNINWLFLYQIFNPLNPSGHYMYRQFKIQEFYILPTQCICVFCVDLRTRERLIRYTAAQYSVAVRVY